MTEEELLKHLKERYTYLPEVGEFILNYQYYAPKGSIAGYIDSQGYRVITIEKKKFYAHRLAILWMTGSFPPSWKHTDHINGKQSDNRWENLRVASPDENAMNSKLRSDNTSGVKGVSYNSNTKLYEAYIWVDRTKKNLGRYPTIEQATRVVANARKEFHKEFAKT